MSSISVAVLAIGMSIDALIAALGRGAAMRRPRFLDALKTGLVFGLVETVTPLLGWVAGIAASQYVDAVDHWIAFGLLAIVGGRMMLHAARTEDAPAEPSRGGSFVLLIATAIGTSIDALAVGVSLAFLDVNILVVAAAIGAATLCMSTGGVLIGRIIGRRFGRWAEALGGLALFGLGASILFEHLTA